MAVGPFPRLTPHPLSNIIVTHTCSQFPPILLIPAFDGVFPHGRAFFGCPAGGCPPAPFLVAAGRNKIIKLQIGDRIATNPVLRQVEGVRWCLPFHSFFPFKSGLLKLWPVAAQHKLTGRDGDQFAKARVAQVAQYFTGGNPHP